MLNPRESEELCAMGGGEGGARGGEYRRNERLLTLVGRTSEEQYAGFLEALKESRHEHLYAALTGGEWMDGNTVRGNCETTLYCTVRGVLFYCRR